VNLPGLEGSDDLGQHTVAYNHSRRSKLRDAAHESRDDAAQLNGYWSREKLERMNAKFVVALRRAHPEREIIRDDDEQAA
jgi:hypothetical protein